jgi:PAS domain-containing protein
MKLQCLLFALYCFIFTGTVFFLTFYSTEDFLRVETEKRAEVLSRKIKKEILKYSVNEDDIALNTYLTGLKEEPCFLKATVSLDGRVIADSEPADLYSASSQSSFSVSKETNTKSLFWQTKIPLENKEYFCALKMSAGFADTLKTSLLAKLVIVCLIFLLTAGFILFFQKKENKPTVFTGANPKENILLLEEETLMTSASALIIVLSGNNRIIKASKKALELFGSEIEGKNIEEFHYFSAAAEGFLKNAKPLIRDGKKYLIL